MLGYNEEEIRGSSRGLPVCGRASNMSWDIVGHENAIAVLQRAVEDESRRSHAYLFAGPEQVGRATVARTFAQALNCTGDDARPCGECRACRTIAEGKHPDVETMTVGGLCDESEHKDHAKDKSQEIRICQVRRLEHVIYRAPFEGRVRVVIVDPADALTAQAANAFLKTLEEPPEHVVMILITSREAKLPETVRSRCRRIAFGGAKREQIESALRERWDAEPETAARLAGLAQGRLGWAVDALKDDSVLETRGEALDEIEELMAGGDKERFEYARMLGDRYQRNTTAVRDLLGIWSDWWRDVLLTASGKEEMALASDRLDTLRSQASEYGVEGAVRALRALQDVQQHLDEHASPTLALEVMLLELPRAAAPAR
jgi:DNA polymerase-3 subunit delta'